MLNYWEGYRDRMPRLASLARNIFHIPLGSVTSYRSHSTVESVLTEGTTLLDSDRDEAHLLNSNEVTTGMGPWKVQSGNPPTLSTLARDTGSKDPIEQSRSDRELRKARLQPDMSYDFRSRQGDFVASSPAYPGLARGASGGEFRKECCILLPPCSFFFGGF